jgi:hypothetical protein
MLALWMELSFLLYHIMSPSSSRRRRSGMRESRMGRELRASGATGHNPLLLTYIFHAGEQKVVARHCDFDAWCVQ